jgi:hypothetical protein
MLIGMLCISLTGCNGKIIKPDSTTGPEHSAKISGADQVRLSYAILPALPRFSGEAESAFSESMAALGIRDVRGAETPDGQRTHIVIYKLTQEKAALTRYTQVPMIFVELGTLFLLPYCEEYIYPLEFHVLAQAGGQPGSIFQEEFTLRECMWGPMFWKYMQERDALRYVGLRAVFDRALRKIISGVPLRNEVLQTTSSPNQEAAAGLR